MLVFRIISSPGRILRVHGCLGNPDVSHLCTSTRRIDYLKMKDGTSFGDRVREREIVNNMGDSQNGSA